MPEIGKIRSTPNGVGFTSGAFGSDTNTSKTVVQTSLTLTGDILGSGWPSINATLPFTGVNAGTYTNARIIVDSKGRITHAENGDGSFGGGAGGEDVDLEGYALLDSPVFIGTPRVPTVGETFNSSELAANTQFVSNFVNGVLEDVNADIEYAREMARYRTFVFKHKGAGLTTSQVIDWDVCSFRRINLFPGKGVGTWGIYNGVEYKAEFSIGTLPTNWCDLQVMVNGTTVLTFSFNQEGQVYSILFDNASHEGNGFNVYAGDRVSLRVSPNYDPNTIADFVFSIPYRVMETAEV